MVEPGTDEALEQQLGFMFEFATPGWSARCAAIWTDFLRRSAWETLAEAPALVEAPDVSLVSHVRATWAISRAVAEVAQTECGLSCDMEALRAIAALHDVSKLVEYEPAPEGARLSSIGRTYPHAVLAGTAAAEAGFPELVVNVILEHPYHPPHVHVVPKSLERIVFHYGDQAAIDTILYDRGVGTHLEFRRFFAVP
ncbi:MAG TPA: HDIG domain-containing protein [Solirubrobacteraceae bacterium]|jgi:putative nucleotidyltransferase with HDIG domain